MKIADKIPTFDDESLATLRENASRLTTAEGDGVRRREAEFILPLIDAEVAKRLEQLPKPKRASARKPRRAVED
jgi:hypothetical protein